MKDALYEDIDFSQQGIFLVAVYKTSEERSGGVGV